MKDSLPRATGLDARFDEELAAAIPGWRPEWALEGVHHNASEHRFELGAGDRLSLLEYRPGDGFLVFTHTFVPPELRGRHIAGRLVTAGLEYARAQGWKVVPQCSYVDTFLCRHGEFADLRMS